MRVNYINDKNVAALTLLKNYRHRLTSQEYKTLRGQALAGDVDGAVRGLKKILRRKAEFS